MNPAVLQFLGAAFAVGLVLALASFPHFTRYIRTGEQRHMNKATKLIDLGIYFCLGGSAGLIIAALLKL